ncbi:hypothetical protein RDV64_15685 [Acuticoccus sp. MNP-M23]|uniref:hypothetical protein n=1 Tax=Acuticoccus sp. MNP-M23 TaxID=3072793 RepID=UPI0028156146|nr:hypothetical protein [Acuticoccus sp. MNP-M23]WMS41513.1 hypothetical protein RDV64_15685 [Acuticoccus sp. MNP-M23]
MALTRLFRKPKKPHVFPGEDERIALFAPLFDNAFYLENHTDVASAGADPRLHYVRDGWKERRQPHPLFDSSWYLTNNQDVADAKVDPLTHYLTDGWREHRSPHPLFDSRRYETLYGIGPSSGHNPLLHYLDIGWQEGMEPHLLFKPVWYLCQNPDVVALEVDPLTHYLTTGWRTGKKAIPAFDPTWYLQRYGALRDRRQEPLTQYLKHGAAEGRHPNAALEAIWGDKRAPIRDRQTPLEAYVMTPDYLRTQDPPTFDADYYANLYPEMADLTRRERVGHFVRSGYAEGRIGHQTRAESVHAKPAVPHVPPRNRRILGDRGRPQYSAPLIVGGFHRSGTSMTTNILADAGLHVGDKLLGAKKSNPYGHYEDVDIIAFHDTLLGQSGQSWQAAADFPPILTPRDWRFMMQYGARKSVHGAWGFKDPRVCLFLPEWHSVFPDLSLLYIYRPCIECVHSLKKRAAADLTKNIAPKANGIFFTNSDVAVSMYLAYAQRVLRFLDGFDGRVKVIALQDLMENRDLVGEIRRDWGYTLADVMPFDVYDGRSLSQSGPNEIIHDPSLLEEIHAVDRAFEEKLN